MKIAFATISNRPDRLPDFADSLIHAALVDGYEYTFNFLLQSPCTENDEKLLRKKLGAKRVRAKHCSSYRCEDGRVYIGKARVDAFGLCDEADYVVLCDDDNRYSRGTKTAKYTHGERIIDAINHLQNDKDCGLVQLRGFFGGHLFGRNIVPYMRSGFYNTEYGLVTRGPKHRGFPLIDPDLIAPGATSDVSIYFTTIMNGYNVVKTFNCPARMCERSTQTVEPNAKNPHYDHTFIWSEQGVQGKFAKKFPPGWKLGGKLPKSLLDAYERKLKERNSK